MDISEIKAEIIAVVLATTGAIGASFKMFLSDRRSIEARIDKLERDTITREEFNAFAKEIYAHNGKLRDLLDSKLDQINQNLIQYKFANKDKGDC